MKNLQVAERRLSPLREQWLYDVLRSLWGLVARERWIMGVWLVQRVLFAALTWLVQRVEHPYYLSGGPSWQTLLIPWGAWDGGAYNDIALHGYTRLTDAGYAPLYPALIWLTRFIPGNAFLLASGAEVAALYLLYDLVCRQYGADVAGRAVLLLAWTPFAAYFSAEYTESLFLLLSVGVFWALQRQHLLLAGLCAAAATLTRQYGILLCLPLLGAPSWRRVAAIALPVAALATFWTAVSWRLGTAFAPLATEQGFYGRHVTWPWWGIVNTVALARVAHTFFLMQHVIVDLTLVGGALVLGVLLVRVRVWREALYVWATILVVLCMPIHASATSNIDALASAPRYLMVLFPLALPVALWAHSPVRKRLVVLPLVASVMVLATLLVAGIWIG